MSTEPAKTTRTNTSKPRPNSPPGRTDKPRASTKQDQLLLQLRRKSGTDVPTICKTFGWQPHTARAALSTLRKAGHDVVRDPGANGKPARYRIIATPDRDAAGMSVTKAPTNAG